MTELWNGSVVSMSEILSVFGGSIEEIKLANGNAKRCGTKRERDYIGSHIDSSKQGFVINSRCD